MAAAVLGRSCGSAAVKPATDPTLEAVLTRLTLRADSRDIDHFLKVVARIAHGPNVHHRHLAEAVSTSRCALLRDLAGSSSGPGIHLLGLRDAAVGLAQAGFCNEAERLIDALAPSVRRDQGKPFRVSAFINDLVGVGAPHAALCLFRALRRPGTSPTSDSLLTALARAAAYAPSRDSLALAVTAAGQMHEALRGPSVTAYSLLIGLALEVASRETVEALARKSSTQATALVRGESARKTGPARLQQEGGGGARAGKPPAEAPPDDDVDPLHRAFALYDGFCDATGRSCMLTNRALILGALVDPHTGAPLPRPLIHVALEALRRCAMLFLGATNAWCSGDAAAERAAAHSRPRPGDSLSPVDGGRFDGLHAWHEGFVALEDGGPSVAAELEEARRLAVVRGVEVPAAFGGAQEGIAAIAAASESGGLCC